MLSPLVDRNSGEEESRCAIVVDPNSMLSAVLPITSGPSQLRTRHSLFTVRLPSIYGD
jgi:hypothetical protein